MSQEGEALVEYFEIPSDNIDEIKNFIQDYSNGHLKKENLRIIG
jgi:hypothetical protein